MMYLSQLWLNDRAQRVIHDLNDPYQMHRTVMSGFPPKLPAGERVLFRLEIENRPPKAMLLVQSHTPPDWNRLAGEGYLLRPAAVKTFAPVFSAGEVFNFRLFANPTKRLHGDGEKDGPRVGLFREEDQLTWLERKAGENGFKTLAVQTTHIIQPDAWKEDKQGKHRIRQQAVCFDGQLQVTNPDAFSQAFAMGIGSGKGMGFGLLSLARAI